MLTLRPACAAALRSGAGACLQTLVIGLGLLCAVLAAQAATPVDAAEPAAHPVLLWDAARQRATLADGIRVTVAGPAQASGSRNAAWTVFGSIPAGGVQHLAPGADDGSVYASATAEGVLKFIDLAGARQVHQVPAAGPAPGPMVYHPVLKRLASFNGGGSVTLFDTDSRAYEGLLPLGEQPSAAALAPDGRVVAVLPGQHLLALLALRPFRMAGRFPLPAACAEPGELLVDAAAQRVFVDCGGSVLAVFDYRQGDWLPDWTWPTPVIPAIAADRARPGPAARRLLRDDRQGRVLALQADGHLVQAAPTPEGAHVLLQVPAGSAAAWDSTHQQLVLASPTGRSADPFVFSFVQVP